MEIKGSEKQTAWAEQIIAKWTEDLNDLIAVARDRVARNSMPAIWAEIVETRANLVLGGMQKMAAESAAKIIERRNFKVADMVEQECGKIYDAQQKAA